MSDDAGNQAAIIGAVIGSIIMLSCMVFVYLYMRAPAETKHGAAQVLSTSECRSLYDGKELDSIYGSAPPLRTPTYDVVSDTKLLPPYSAVRVDGARVHIYDSVASVQSHEYEGTASKLDV